MLAILIEEQPMIKNAFLDLIDPLNLPDMNNK
jgi:hypothetical protein